MSENLCPFCGGKAKVYDTKKDAVIACNIRKEPYSVIKDLDGAINFCKEKAIDDYSYLVITDYLERLRDLRCISLKEDEIIDFLQKAKYQLLGTQQTLLDEATMLDKLIHEIRVLLNDN